MQYHAIPCKTMQYYAIQCNSMQYHASFITADGAYHCPVGSIMAIFDIDLVDVDLVDVGLVETDLQAPLLVDHSDSLQLVGDCQAVSHASSI